MKRHPLQIESPVRRFLHPHEALGRMTFHLLAEEASLASHWRALCDHFEA